ncbi:glutamate--cysteine ligase [Nocardioides marmorisolisilvae]|uniref:Putative glutamate--cysteine ligase 2 n=1 Tax=Nocardioides marmorisolisilvae TaxID=1542737 RepID=A0A3N0DU06_9ACTN|nr:glutamate--cysteine ligase [Nocardioides marmorisolisilvae]RNL79104.1 glutamate--cysteine ligase [Nocardioides marmorisolisilvae]
MAIEFADSPGPSLGVEWEFALVDKRSRDLVNAARDLLERFTEVHGHEPRLHRELLRNTIELTTGICRNTDEALGELTEMIAKVRPVADELGVDLYCAGTHPFADWSGQQLTAGHRYEELIARTQWWGRQMLIWGVHVHVGVRREHVVPIVSALMKWYPHLLALSASSPIWSGTDTGYASNRALMFQQLPTAGLPFQFETWAEFEHYAQDLLTTGVIDQIDEIRWDVRPAPRTGTVEVRICDGVSTVEEMRALVALTHCLVVHLVDRLEAGETLPTLPPWHVQENKWRAARYGLDAWIILDAESNERLLLEDLEDLLDDLLPVARRLDCVEDLALVRTIPKRGASYQRQRRVAERTYGDFTAVVDAVVRELAVEDVGDAG